MNNEDLISRQAAIDTYLETVSSLCVDEGDGMLTACARDRDILEMLENLPSVQPKTGHWVDIMVGDMPAQACDLCKTFFSMAYTGGGHHYCPNCGAKMKGGAE